MNLESKLVPEDLVLALQQAIDRAVEANGGSTRSVKPGHRVKFHWPPPAVGREYNIHPSDFTAIAEFQAHGETFSVTVAETRHGVFGRCEALWLESMGKDEATMLRKMREAAEPLFKRQIAINQALGQPGRFKGSIRDLSPVEILLLLYCEDRDVANTARIEIETHTRTHLYSQALISILRDRRHPQRRIAQWCVLDLFEDLGSYAITKDETDDALAAMKGLLQDAEDDFARAVFKAGTVIGGHLQSAEATRALLDCLASPSRIGRRSAIHGLFHVVEWHPQVRAEIVAALRAHASEEKDSQLKDFSERMADDIESSAYDHIPEPIFHDEP